MRYFLKILLFLIPTFTFADVCPTPYNKSSLKYPSRQQLCPNGTFFIDYLTGKSHPCEDGQVDHVIPTKLVYSLGICGDKLKTFSADRDNLRLTFSRLNLEKSDKNPFLYATRHGEKAEAAVENIVRKMSAKYPEIVEDQLKAEAKRLKDAEIRTLYRQKNRALNAARLQQKARKEIHRRINVRMVKALSRNSSITALESSTFILAPIALTAIAWDIYDTCNTIKDLNELDDIQNDFSDDISICGMNEDEILAFLGMSPKQQVCIRARISKNEMSPRECEGFDASIPSYDAEETIKRESVEIPSYD